MDKENENKMLFLATVADKSNYIEIELNKSACRQLIDDLTEMLDETNDTSGFLYDKDCLALGSYCIEFYINDNLTGLLPEKKKKGIFKKKHNE